MRRHADRTERGPLGATILAVLGIFLALHLAFPEAVLWPAALVTLAVSTMIVSHLKKDRRERSDIRVRNGADIG